jgi:alpha-ribazole phosphatase
MLRLLLVRHGETDWNAQKRYQGQADLPLNHAGVEQARRLAERLRQKTIDIIYSSDLLRASQTAAILAEGRGIQPVPDARLREMNFGVLEGLRFDEANLRWPKMIAAWLQDYNQPPQGGERMDEFCARVAGFTSQLRQENEDKCVLVVAHGGPLREIIKAVLGVPSVTSLWFNLDHAGLSEIQIHPETILIDRLNDTGHLD